MLFYPWMHSHWTQYIGMKKLNMLHLFFRLTECHENNEVTRQALACRCLNAVSPARTIKMSKEERSKFEYTL